MKVTMNSKILQLAAHVLVLSAMSASAAIRYVNVNSANPASPYTNWTTAATTIQDTVDAAVTGDQILVTNGVYQTGGRVVFGAMTNRVAVSKPVTVQSVNGAAVTVIRGYQVPGTTNGDSATRCVYLTNGAALAGFTLTNGATRSLGDGDFAREQSGGGVWCESPTAVVSDCVLTGNAAGVGGGGGANGGTLNNCTLIGNWTSGEGGGANAATLNNSALTGNSANQGGGVAGDSTLNNCQIAANSTTGGDGGGAIGGTLSNCTITDNSAGVDGGGVYGCTVYNCIVYYNSARRGDNNYSESVLSYSCTTPLPPRGLGNISAEPQLADLFHLTAGSPCRGTGSATYAAGMDIDGEAWANPPSIGCDEYRPGAVTGPLIVSIQAAFTNVAVGFGVDFTAAITGRATANRWEFGDGAALSNRLDASHSWAVAGDHTVVFRASNDAYPGGISATVTMHVVAQPVHYVALGSVNPVAPYTSWATASTNIQDAVDAVSAAGALVLVTNGIYQTGERVAFGAMTNRVVVDKPVTVQSVNGAAVTIIQGDQVMRCVYLTNGAALVGFTMTNGVADDGGGVWCVSTRAVVSNCVLTSNRARPNGNFALGGGAAGGTLNNCLLTANWAVFGGGASACTLNNCTLTNNSAFYGGGGARGSTLYNCVLTGNSTAGGVGGGANYCTLNNCTLSGNSAAQGGGAYGCAINNCIVYYNSARSRDNYSDDSFLNYSCTIPLPTNGTGNLTSAPLFLNQDGGNLRLQSNSPCINAGYNASAPAGPDLDGNPRIAGGVVDMGAYEFQSPQSLISYAWLQQYNLPIDGSRDLTDTDSDGLNNWQEWHAGTNPTNALSVLRLLSPAPGAPGLVVSWQSVSGLNYFIARGTDLGMQPPFLPLATNIVGQPGTTIFTDTNAVGAGPFFYRVAVQE